VVDERRRTMTDINPEDWPFDELNVPSLEHQAYYDALDIMDQKLTLLAEEHQSEMEKLVADFYAQMEEIMQEYKNAIEYDIKSHTPWLLDQDKFKQHFEESDDNDNE